MSCDNQRYSCKLKFKPESNSKIITLSYDIICVLDFQLSFLDFVTFEFLISIWALICVAFRNQLLHEPKYRNLIITLINRNPIYTNRIFEFIPTDMLNTNVKLIKCMKRAFINPCKLFNSIYGGDDFQVNQLIRMFIFAFYFNIEF